MNNYEIVVSNELTNLQKKDVWNIIVQADYEFVPPLSERESTTQKNLNGKTEQLEKSPKAYFESLLAQKFLLVEKENSVIAFMSYIPAHRVEIGEGKEVVANYVSTVIVDKAHRSKGLTELLYKQLLEKETGHVATRTWSTNGAHLHILEKLGFENVYTIENDRGNGIDTVYYVK